MPGFDLTVNVSLAAVFVQGLLSFFSPCVLPLLPLYLGYLAGGTGTAGPDGSIRYRRSTVLLNTFFFVVGISAAFFLLALGMTALGQALHRCQTLITQIGGILIVAFGLYQLGAFRPAALERERRLPFRLDKLTMNPLVALAMGFTFSFAWTPCVGPALASVLLMAGSADTAAAGFALIGLYTLGFVLPFLVVGLSAGAVLGLLRRHRNIMKYTVKVGGALLVVIGVLMVTGWMNGVSTSLVDSAADLTADPGVAQSAPVESGEPEESQANAIPAPDFTLADQFGEEHTLSDYAGQTVLLNFWATWCGPCRSEMPDLQAIYEDYGLNQEDLVVLGVAAPNYGGEGSAEAIASFLEENGYTYPVVMDESASQFYAYGISAYPTTFMIDADGNVFGYVEGALTREIFDDIIQQTMTGERR